MRSVLMFLVVFVHTGVFSAPDYLNKKQLIEKSTISVEQLNHWRNDLLFPHLQEAWLSKNIRSISQQDVDTFINTPENKAAAWFFKPKWHSELVRRKDWNQINKQFVLFNDPHLRCWFFHSQKELKQPIKTALIKDLWMTGASQPDHCDPFFKAWIRKIDNPDPMVWDRQIKAFYSRNGKLLNYLNQFYGSDTMKDHGEFLVSVYNNPKTIISKIYDPNSEQMRELALAAVNRMAFKDPKSASNLWLQILNVSPGMTQSQIRRASRYLGIAMAKQAVSEAYYWLSLADPDYNDEEVQHWRLQIVLSDKDYYGVLELYRQISRELKQDAKWQYWMGLAKYKTEGTLSDDNPLTALSRRRLYYGYLAAGVLGTKPSLNASPDYPPVNAEGLMKQDELQRAKALLEAGQTKRAQVEWNLYVKYQDNATQHAAAELAFSWDWYAKASQSAGWSGRFDLIHLRYPDAFEEHVKPYAKALDIPDFWVYGVMRQESRYEHIAVSPAGALGLMQIMPRTAKVTAQKYGIRYAGTSDLHDPKVNIAIGTRYLEELIGQFSHPVYATAAYNAGPSRVITWRARFPNDMTVWIESIPFNETRNYVKSVLAYSQIYALTDNLDWHLASWTTPEINSASLGTK